MTPAEHAELSALVARAIGWPQVLQWGTWLGRHGPHVTVMSPRDDRKVFDYRDPSVALGLLKWLIKQDCDIVEENGMPAVFVAREGTYQIEPTLELAIARAVLAVALKGKMP